MTPRLDPKIKAENAEMFAMDLEETRAAREIWETGVLVDYLLEKGKSFEDERNFAPRMVKRAVDAVKIRSMIRRRLSAERMG